MKVIYFLKWCGTKSISLIVNFNRWDYCWLATCLLGGYAAGAKFDLDQLSTQLLIGWTVVVYGLYGIVYCGIKHLWKKFQDEQERMLEHLKDIG
jgi:hypothetical protein